MNPDPFEERLAQLRPRSLPASWRREILAAAELKRRRFFLLDWLPGRRLSASLATAWVVILLLRLTTPMETPSPRPTINARVFAQAHQDRWLLIASFESPASSEPELGWLFPFEKRPL